MQLQTHPPPQEDQVSSLFPISLFRHKRDNVPRLVERTWAELCDNFRRPHVRAAKDGPLFSPAVFDPPRRAKAHVRELSMLVLDVDHGADLEGLKASLPALGCRFLISSTHSHLRRTESNPEAEPRLRVVIPLVEPIPASEFPGLWQYVKQKTKIHVDEATKDASRIYYTPAIAAEDAPYEFFSKAGPELVWRSLPLQSAVRSHIEPAPQRLADGNGSSILIGLGSRNPELFKLGKKLYNSGLPQTSVTAALLAENQERCETPLPECEVREIAQNASIYPITFGGEPDGNSLPIPLPENRVTTPELDEQLLPTAWRTWLADVSDRLQCPLDYAAVAAIVSAASLVGNRVRVRPKEHDSWLVVPNLWGAIVGPPGVMKTPAVNEGLLFFREIANKERAAFERDRKDLEFEKEFNESKRAELLKEMKKAPPEKKSDFRMRFENLTADEPVEKRLWTTDATVEKLGELLNENPDGLLVIRDELTGWLKTLEKHGHEQDRAFYLEAWNGEGAFSFDRIGRGTTYVRNLTISLLGTIQPSMIEPYYRSAMSGSGDDGLIQRFQLLVYPEVGKKYTYVDRPPAGRGTARGSFEKLYAMSPKDVDAKFLTPEAGGHAFLQFGPAAQEFFEGWLTELETELRSGSIQSPALESHISKYRSLMPSLALIFHLLKRVNGETSNPSIDIDTVQLAAAWCSYLQRHAEKLYTLASLSEFDCAREILKRIGSGDLAGEFTAKEIYGRHWKRLSQPDDVKRGLGILSDYGHLQPLRLDTGGRAKTVYVAHESLKGK